MKTEIPTKVAAGIKWVKQFKEVQTWLDEVYAEKTGSERTIKAYARELWRFCVWEKKTPTELIKVASDHVKAEMQADIVPPKTYAEKIVLQYFHHLIKKTPVDGVVKTKEKLDRVTAAYKYGYLRSFYRYNGIIFKGKTPSATSRSRIHLPTPEDLSKVWKAATLGEKLALGCLRYYYGDQAVNYEVKRLVDTWLWYEGMLVVFTLGLPEKYAVALTTIIMALKALVGRLKETP